MADLTDWAPIFANMMAGINPIPGPASMPTLFDTFYKFCTPKNWVQKCLTHLNFAGKKGLKAEQSNRFLH